MVGRVIAFLGVWLLGIGVCFADERFIIENSAYLDNAAIARVKKLGGRALLPFGSDPQVYEVAQKSVREFLLLLSSYEDVKVHSFSGDYLSLFTTNEQQPTPEYLSALEELLGTQDAQLLRLANPSLAEQALFKGLAEDGTFKIPLTDGSSVTVESEPLTTTGSDLTLQGSLSGEEGEIVLVKTDDNTIIGTISTATSKYFLNHLDGSLYLVSRIGKGFSLQEPSLPSEEIFDFNPEDLPELSPEEDTVFVDCLVAYTTTLVESQSPNLSASHLQDITKVAIKEANKSFSDSGIENLRLRVVNISEFKYHETTDWKNHLRSFARSPEIKILRDRVKADICVLIVADRNCGGEALKVFPDAEEAYCVVSLSGLQFNYSLPHEIGHIFGARHDSAQDSSDKPFQYGHGYILENEDAIPFRTIMGYGEGCNGCLRKPYWSGPDVFIGDYPAGSEYFENNVRVLKKSARRVSEFR